MTDHSNVIPVQKRLLELVRCPALRSVFAVTLQHRKLYQGEQLTTLSHHPVPCSRSRRNLSLAVSSSLRLFGNSIPS